uniref:2-iminobutanoate/2-iminopropanoate deaminase n=1 Tax=Macaca mulatta TaxID=9544 RepID=A0A1D5R7M5_MACMU
MTGSNSHITILTLNVNGLNAPIKRHGLANWIKSQDPGLLLLKGLQEGRLSHVVLDQKGDQHHKSPRGHWTLQALKNMGEILKAAGCDFTNVVKTTVLLADINDFNTVNEIYKQYFKSNFPARAAYQVVALSKGSRVEIEAVAVQGPLTTASL